jgi:hypothetical protein
MYMNWHFTSGLLTGLLAIGIFLIGVTVGIGFEYHALITPQTIEITP